MKKFFALTTSFFAACSAIAAGGAVASAQYASVPEGGIDNYPESFIQTYTFDDLEDYAVYGNRYAFLQNNEIFEYDGENLQSFNHGTAAVLSVHFNDDGVLCYGTGGGYYSHLWDGSADKLLEDFDPVYDASFTLSDGFHYFTSQGVVRYLDENDPEASAVALDGFSNLKKSGDSAYAVKDNSLYEIKRGVPEEKVIRYADYEVSHYIQTGDLQTVIKTFSSEKPLFVTFKNGALMSEIDLAASIGEFFEVSETVRAGEDVEAESGLLLCKVGNEDSISVVTCGGKCYIMRTADTLSLPRNNAVTPCEFTEATVTVGEYLYSAPFFNESTHLTEIRSGDSLTVLGEVGEIVNPELQCKFYLVEYESEGETITGYVPYGYIRLENISEHDPEPVVDPDYSENDLVKPVVLVLMVILLVLIAAGYLIYSATSGKKKKKNIKKENEEE